MSPHLYFLQFLGTFLLLIVIWAVTDPRNGPPPPGMIPLVVFIAILGIGATFGMQTGQSKSIAVGV
jgi:aquaglyceroporin related protein